MWSFLSCCFKQEQIVNTVTDCVVQITIVQIVLVSIWQTQYRRWCWRNHISMICLFVFNKLTWCSPEWLLSVWGSVAQINWRLKINLWPYAYRKPSIPIKLSCSHTFITLWPICICKSFLVDGVTYLEDWMGGVCSE